MTIEEAQQLREAEEQDQHDAIYAPEVGPQSENYWRIRKTFEETVERASHD